MSTLDQLIAEIYQLPLAERQTLLRKLQQEHPARPQGVPGTEMLAGFAPIDDASAKEMITAIEAGCEEVDASEW